MNRCFFSLRYFLITLTLLPATFSLAEDEPVGMDMATPYEFWPLFIKMLLLLAVMLGVLLGASYFLKRLMAQRGALGHDGSQIEIVERKPLDHKTTLYLFRVGDQEIFAAEHATGFCPLGQWRQNKTQMTDSK